MSEEKHVDWGTLVLKHPLWGLVIAAISGAVAAKVLDWMWYGFTTCFDNGLLAAAPCVLLDYVIFLLGVTAIAFFITLPIAGVYWAGSKRRPKAIDTGKLHATTEAASLDVDSDDLSAYIKSVVEGVKKGIPGEFQLAGGIKFEISVAKVKEAGAGFKVIVAEAGGKYAQQEVSKIAFEVNRPIKIPGYSAPTE